MGRDTPKPTTKQRQRMRKKEKKINEQSENKKQPINIYDKCDIANECVIARRNGVPNNGDWTPHLFHIMKAEQEMMDRYEEEF